MKNTYTCPKCASHDIIRVPGPASHGYTQNVVPKSFFTKANVDRYICSVCGFTEEWIAKEKDLAALKKKYMNKDKGGADFV